MYLQYGVPVALATDDLGVSRSTHTREWVKAVEEQGSTTPRSSGWCETRSNTRSSDTPTKTRLKQDLEARSVQFEQRQASMAMRGGGAGGGAVIDSHCHLADEVFAADLESVVARARDAGLERALVILSAGDEKEAAQAARVEALVAGRAVRDRRPSASRAASSPIARTRAADVVRAQFAGDAGARAVGEIGLDYHYDFSPRDVQIEVFRAQVRLARELRQPVVIHTREADDDTIAILREDGGGDSERRAALLHGRSRRWRARASSWDSTSRWPASLPFRRPRSCARPCARCPWTGC